MAWRSKQRGDALVVELDGAVDHGPFAETAKELEQAVVPAVEKAGQLNGVLVIDMTGVDYMSSAELRVLMRASNRAKEMAVQVRLARLNDTMREIIQISRFDRIIQVFDTVQEAVAE